MAHSNKHLFQEAVQDSPIFLELFNSSQDDLITNGILSGYKISIKATFDVKGYSTSGGSLLLGHRPAKQDAKAVSLLKNAGAFCLGHTNMTELAYSGLGLNPHFGTPENPLVKGAIPGGSTSGGAVSVAKGIADVALGTDTGGSLRIPAAFCGLTGFKPSQQSVSRHGCLPLSDQLDSVGPIAKTVADCRVVWEVLSEQNLNTTKPTANDKNQAAKVEFIIPENFGFDDIDPKIHCLFEQAVEKIEQAGYSVKHQHIELVEQYKQLPIWHFSAVESKRYYRSFFDLNSPKLDPRIKSRIQKGMNVSDEMFEQTCEQRVTLIEQYEKQFDQSIILLPTVACQAPQFKLLEDDNEYDKTNLLCLRNTSLANVLNGCSLSLPYRTPDLTIGILLNMVNDKDIELLDVSQQLEDLFSKTKFK